MLRTISKWPRRLVRRALNRYAPPEVRVAIEYLKADAATAFPARNMVVTREVPTASVLVLAPHPDDEVIGMGGTLHMHVTNGSRVTVLYMTDGAGLGASRGELTGTRRREARRFGHACGVEQIFWDEKDTCLTNGRETVNELTDVIRKVRPSCVYLPSYFDRHYDHFSANAILAGALERLPSTEITVLGYEVWDNIPFHNYVVDISRHVETKKSLMQHYRTPLQFTDFIQLFECRGAAHYMLYVDSRVQQEGTRYAEAFSRFDARTYRQLFESYVKALRAHRSPMVRHLCEPEC